MTLQSYPSHSEEVVASGASSSSSSASTSSTDVCPLPLSIGQKEIVLSNDERALIAELPDVNLLAPGANINITDSTNVDVGNRTTFNRDVTIYQIIQGSTLPEIQNGVAGHEEVVCNKNDRAKNQRTNQNVLCKWRHLFVPFIFLLLLLLILVSLFIFRESIFNRAPTFPPTNPDTKNFIQGYPVYSKINWGALPEKEIPPLLSIPTPLVIISHSATQSCTDFKECANETQHIQYKFLKGGHKDIGYNFLIGGEGGIYEGRGWEHQNSLRAKSISISFIGDFNKELLRTTAQNAAHALLEEGVKRGMLDENYRLIGENQTSPLRYYSPGWNTVKEIKNWEHYFPGTML